MNNVELREKLIVMITEKLIVAGLRSDVPQDSAFHPFLRSNPILLVDAIMAGKQMTGEDLLNIMGDYDANSSSTSIK